MIQAITPQEASFLNEIDGKTHKRFRSLDVPNPAAGPWIIAMKTASLPYVKVTVVDNNYADYIRTAQSHFPLPLVCIFEIAIDPVRMSAWREYLKDNLVDYRTETDSNWYTFSPNVLDQLIAKVTTEADRDNARVAAARLRWLTGTPAPAEDAKAHGLRNLTPVVEEPAPLMFPDGLPLLERAKSWLISKDYAAFSAYATLDDRAAFWEGYKYFKELKASDNPTWQQICRSFYANAHYIEWLARTKNQAGYNGPDFRARLVAR